jgi:hypothetical protein
MSAGSGGTGFWAVRRGLAGLACVLAWWAGAAIVAPSAARAVINDTDGDTGPTEGPCPLSAYDFKLEGNLVVVGLPFVGGPVKIDATSAKLVGTKGTAARICEVLLFQIPRFQWSVAAAPPGQSAAIANASTLSPSVNLGGAGAYRIRLTACSPSCRLTLSGRSRTIGPLTREVTINAITEFAPPPETEASPPPLSPPPQNWTGPRTAPPTFTFAQRDKACQGGGGFKDPQWVTAEPFRGAIDYRSVEGEVDSSHIASEDDFLNHDSQDHNWIVKPDPPFSGLAQPSDRREMEMELETDHLPREFRPTSGDRTVTIGHWIFDCGHEFQTEIHPAVGLAVERPRPVQIPASFRAPGFPNGFGSNVVVPGIVTDILFNRRSGEITNNCSTTGLHQPPVTITVRGVQVTTDGPCIREPHPVNRRFTFNVYLPRNPLLRARELGLNPPPVPLFVGTQTIGAGGGPSPSVVVREDPGSGATWLEVTVDLSGFTGSAYARRISAAWAYPQSQNWGARRWRVTLENMKIIEDAEPDNPGPDIDQGDWRVFFNTNNRDREWTKILDCDECVDEGDTKTLNLQTGGSGLGPDPVLFPGQTIFVHTSGFDDEVAGDDTGSVFLRMGQRNASHVTAFSQGGDGIYHLNFSIRESTPVGGAVLTPEAAALASAYTVSASPPCVATQALAIGVPGGVRPVCAPAARDPNLEQTWHPDSLVLRTRVVRARNLELFEGGEVERHTVQGITVAELRQLLRSMSPAERGRLLDEIRRELRAVPVSLRGDYDELVATLDRTLPPSLVARALPPGFRARVRLSPLIRGR